MDESEKQRDRRTNHDYRTVERYRRAQHSHTADNETHVWPETHPIKSRNETLFAQQEDLSSES